MMVHVVFTARRGCGGAGSAGGVVEVQGEGHERRRAWVLSDNGRGD